MSIYFMMNNIKEKYALLLHYRNPYVYCAGSENFIISQVNEFEKLNISSVVIFPILKNLNIGPLKVTIKSWGIVYKGRFVEGMSLENLVALINSMNESRKCQGVFIYSVIFMKVAELNVITSFCKNVYLYLHDFCTCCPQYNLLKNGITFCGGAVLSNNKCGECKFFADAKSLQVDIDKYLTNIEELIIIAPSGFVKKLWLEAYPKFKKNIIVQGHKVLKGQYTENTTLLNKNERIRIAFVGKGVVRKGYNEWIKTVDKIANSNNNYEFFHLGNAPQQRDYINNIQVSILEDGQDAMIKKLREYNIHAVVLFSCVPETYSYTYYESLSANAFVITSDLSGNIAVEIQGRGNGVVIDFSSEALFDLLNDYDKFLELINRYRIKGEVGPQYLENNNEYLALLKHEKCRMISYKGNITETISAKIATILYRIRYGFY